MADEATRLVPRGGGDGWRDRPSSVPLAVSLALVCDYSLFGIITPIAPHVLGPQGVTELELGLLFASKSVVQLVANPVFGHMADKSGGRWPLTLGVVVLLASALLYLCSETYWPMFAARCVQGVGSAAMSTGGFSYVSRVYHDGEERAMALAWVLNGIAIGCVSGPAAGSFLLTTLGPRAPFAAVALVALLALLAILLLRVEAVRQFKPTSDGMLRAYASAFSDSFVVVIFILMLFANAAVCMLEPLLPLDMQARLGLPVAYSGYVFLGDSLSYTLLNPVMAYLGKWGRWRMMLLGIVVMAFGVSGLGVGPTIWAQVGYMSAMGGGMAAVDACGAALMSIVVDKRLPGQHGVGFSIIDMSMCLGGIFGPIVGGFLSVRWGFEFNVRCFGVACLLCAPLMLHCRHINELPVPEGRALSPASSTVQQI